MDDRREKARTKEGVHEEPHEPVGGPPELGTQGENPTANSRGGEKREVEVANRVVVVETEMGPRNTRPPHDKHDAEVIQLVAKLVHVGAVVREGVKDGREDEADDDAGEVHPDSESILEYQAMRKP